MFELAAILVLAALVAGIYVAAKRANEVFRIDVRGGRVRNVRGDIRQTTVHAMGEVCRRARVDQAVIRGVRRGGETRLVVSGTDDMVAQRLRNTFAASA